MRFITLLTRFGALLTLTLLAAWSPVAAIPEAENLASFGPDCETPKTVFVIGDPVCVMATGPLLGPPAQRRFEWVAPDGTIFQLGPDIIVDSQSDSITIPKSGSFAQVGTWTVKTVNTYNNAFAVARFVVHDPGGAASDLSVSMFGSTQITAGSSATFTLIATNSGPNDAKDVRLVVTEATNSVDTRAEQTAGPVFGRANPAMGSGAIIFTIADLPANSIASFVLIHQLTADLPSGAGISSTATISSSTQELYAADNVATATATITPQPCRPSCPSNIVATKPPGKCGVVVSYSPPGSSGAKCGLVTCSPASGSFFPVGSSNVICFGETGSPCSFTVTVEAQQSPTLSCPSDITASEGSPGMGLAIVRYNPPTLNEDCAAESTVCAPPSGSSFPLGATSVSCEVKNSEDQQANCSFVVNVEACDCAIEAPVNMIRSNEPGRCGAVVSYATPSTVGKCGTITCLPPSGGVFPVGVTAVSCIGASGSSSSFAITIQDTVGPALAGVSATPSSLFPLNGKMIDVTVDYFAEDNCEGEPVCFLSIQSNQGEPDRDWEILDAHHVRLRAARSETAAERIYMITVTCRDAEGNASSKTVKVLAR